MQNLRFKNQIKKGTKSNVIATFKYNPTFKKFDNLDIQEKS